MFTIFNNFRSQPEMKERAVLARQVIDFVAGSNPGFPDPTRRYYDGNALLFTLDPIERQGKVGC